MPERFVFVVTYGRSGSTLLQNVLNAVPGWCVRGENNDVAGHLAKAWAALAFNEPTLSHRRIGRALSAGHPWYGSERVDPDRLGRELAELFVRRVLDPPEGTRVAGFKEIRWHGDPRFFRRRMGFLLRFFPDARFVFNTRDHAAVARSGWWAEMDPVRVRAVLEGAETLFGTWIRAHPRRAVAVRYDDYADRPEALRPMFEFLDAPFDADRVAGVMARRLTHLAPPRED